SDHETRRVEGRDVVRVRMVVARNIAVAHVAILEESAAAEQHRGRMKVRNDRSAAAFEHSRKLHYRLCERGHVRQSEAAYNHIETSFIQRESVEVPDLKSRGRQVGLGSREHCGRSINTRYVKATRDQVLRVTAG